MTASRPIVKVGLTKEQKLLVPDWEERVAKFQRRCDQWTKEDRFRLCLHEGSHALQFRKLYDVEFHGPYACYEDGELHLVSGAVSSKHTYEPLDCQHAMVSIAGFWTVEHFTALPESPTTIKNDIRVLRSKLGENADMNVAVYSATILLESQLDEPNLLRELEQAVREYEMTVFGTDEATTWGWREYRPELPGKRHRVVVPSSGHFGTLVEHDGDLKLVVEGEVFCPGDELRGIIPEVRIAEPQRAEEVRAVRRWNETGRG